MDSIYMLFDALIFGCGLYALWQWIQFKRAGELMDSKLIYPTGSGLQDCKDPDGYYRFIMPHYLVFSVMAVICGALSLADDFLKLFDALVGAILNGVFFAIIIYFIVVMKRGHNRFFLARSAGGL